MDIDRGGIWGCVPFHAAYDFLAVVAVIDIRCKHLIVGVVVTGDVEGIKAE